VDQLADEYANKPVVFLEHDVDNAAAERYNRWWRAYSGTGPVTLPLVMVDSGQYISYGYVDFYKVYKSMVEAEINRPAEAEIEAYAWREGNKVKFSISVTNHSNATLDYFTNRAMVHALVYEDADDGVTSRIVRGDAGYDIYLQTPGSLSTYTLETNELEGVDWDKLHFIAIVDYRPGGNTGPYDILQAAEAQEISFSIRPNPLVFMVDLTDPPPITSTITLAGHDSLDWSVSENIDWLTISPTSGSFPASPLVAIEKSKLTLGWQPEETLIFNISSDDGLHFEENVEVKAFYGSVKKAYLPLLTR